MVYSKLFLFFQHSSKPELFLHDAHYSCLEEESPSSVADSVSTLPLESLRTSLLCGVRAVNSGGLVQNLKRLRR